MRSQRLFASSSTSDICIFCACRLQSRASPSRPWNSSFRPALRTIATSRSSRQNAEAAPLAESEPAIARPQARAFSAAEQSERDELARLDQQFGVRYHGVRSVDVSQAKKPRLRNQAGSSLGQSDGGSGDAPKTQAASSIQSVSKTASSANGSSKAANRKALKRSDDDVKDRAKAMSSRAVSDQKPGSSPKVGRHLNGGSGNTQAAEGGRRPRVDGVSGLGPAGKRYKRLSLDLNNVSGTPRDARFEPPKPTLMPGFLSADESELQLDKTMPQGWGKGSTTRASVKYGVPSNEPEKEPGADLRPSRSSKPNVRASANAQMPASSTDIPSIGAYRLAHGTAAESASTDVPTWEAEVTPPPESNSADGSDGTSTPMTPPEITSDNARYAPSTPASPTEPVTTSIDATFERSAPSATEIKAPSSFPPRPASRQPSFSDMFPPSPLQNIRDSLPSGQPQNQGDAFQSTSRQDKSAPTNIFNTGYRSTIITPRDSTLPKRSDSEQQPDNWTHFKPREPEQPAARDNQSKVLSPAMIDSQFEQYRLQRDAMRRQQQQQENPLAFFRSPAQSPMPQTMASKDIPMCVRCRQPGHVKQNCPLAKCNKCGQMGHDGGVCPNSQVRSFAQQNISRNNVSGYNEDRSSQSDVAPSLHQRRGEEDVEGQKAEGDRSLADAVDRTLRSKRFGDVGERSEGRRRKGRRYDEDDDNDRPMRRSDDEDDFEDREAVAARNARKAERQAKKDREKKQKEIQQAKQRSRHGQPISLPDFITASNLAQALHIHYDKFTRRLAKLGYEDVFANKVFNSETSAEIAVEFGFDPYSQERDPDDIFQDLKALPEPAPEDKDLLPVRPPVVTIMGHVDHGKTTILDYLRKANVVAGEAGGITQHIGAFSVNLEATGRTITFLDTPGHAAFLAMRQRGAIVTDIVVLVVAADDSVKPQTLEALKHARDAKVPIIVAINKIDKPDVDIQRVKQDLSQHGVEIEDYGGDTQVVLVSGKTGRGMAELEEAIVTQGEILDHRADADGVVEGWVVEATTKERGRVATVLVRRGTLRVGTILVAGRTWARVRSIQDDAGREVAGASPGIPVEIDGWRDQPIAGDEVLQAEDEQRATEVVEYRQEIEERKQLVEDTEAINQARIQEQAKRAQEETAPTEGEKEATDEESTGQIVVPFIIKADVSGSAEAVEAYIMSVASPLAAPQILSSSVGQVSEGDVEMAIAAKGHIISFNLPINEGLKGFASSQGVKILENNIIYRTLDDVKQVLEEKLPPRLTQKVTGEAEISVAFDINLGGRKSMKIAGSKVRNGVINRSSQVRVMRGTTKVYDGILSSLKNVKKDVTEMRKGTECGIGFEEWEDFEIGDVIQTYTVVSEKRTL